MVKETQKRWHHGAWVGGMMTCYWGLTSMGVGIHAHVEYAWAGGTHGHELMVAWVKGLIHDIISYAHVQQIGTSQIRTSRHEPQVVSNPAKTFTLN